MRIELKKAKKIVTQQEKSKLISVVRKQIGFNIDVDVIIKYVESFDNYKFEEFISLV